MSDGYAYCRDCCKLHKLDVAPLCKDVNNQAVVDSSTPETFTDYLARQLGTDKWVLAPRLTKRLRESGYTVALSQAAYNTHEAEWERQHYSAPLAALHLAAPAMLRALRACVAATDDYFNSDEKGDLTALATAACDARNLIGALREATPASRPAAE